MRLQITRERAARNRHFVERRENAPAVAFAVASDAATSAIARDAARASTAAAHVIPLVAERTARAARHAIAFAFNFHQQARTSILGHIARQRSRYQRDNAFFAGVRQKTQIPEIDTQNGRIEQHGHARRAQNRAIAAQRNRQIKRTNAGIFQRAIVVHGTNSKMLRRG